MEASQGTAGPLVTAGCPTETEVDSTGKKRRQGAELFSDDQRGVIREHDPADPTRMWDVPPAIYPITTAVAALAIPGMLWCSANQYRWYPHRSACCAGRGYCETTRRPYPLSDRRKVEDRKRNLRKWLHHVTRCHVSLDSRRQNSSHSNIVICTSIYAPLHDLSQLIDSPPPTVPLSSHSALLTDTGSEARIIIRAISPLNSRQQVNKCI